MCQNSPPPPFLNVEAHLRRKSNIAGKSIGLDVRFLTTQRRYRGGPKIKLSDNLLQTYFK